MAKRRRGSASRRGGVGLLLLLAAMVLGLSFLPRATGAALLLGRWQRLALGEAAVLIPVLLFLTGLVLIAARGRARFTPRVQGLAAAAIAAAGAGHALVPPGEEFAAMRVGEGTGAVGAVLTWGARALVGEAGLWLLILLTVMVGVLRFFQVPAARIVEGLLGAAKGLWLALRFSTRLSARAASVLGRAAWEVTRFGAHTVSAAATDGIGRVRAATARRLETRRAPRRAAEMLVPVAASSGSMVGGSASSEAPSSLEPPGVLPLVPASVTAAEASGSRDVESAPPPAARRRTPRPQERTHQESLLVETPPQYEIPPLTLLGDLLKNGRGQRWDPSDTARALEQTLASFGVDAKVIHWEQGPVVTRFEVQPAPGVRVQKIAILTNDIALNLAAPSVRIEAPIPGKSAVGIEIPNQKSSLVHVKEILAAPLFQGHKGALVMALGKDLTGHPIVADLTEMPHLLIAGTTGSGKSVALNAIIASFLFRYTPHQLRFVMIDPKRIELINYNDIPHLLVPVVINPRAAAGALREMLRVMEERFTRFAEAGVRNIQAYNNLTDVTPLAYIVIVIDELADLMMVAPADFEDVIVRLAQMTRATGIHLVVATQRPSVDVITGLIKANIPSRIAFAVSSQVDSRTIIDGPGAEKLLGRGDMLFLPMGASRPVRAQGSFIADAEIQVMVDWWRGQGKPAFDQTLVAAGQKMAAGEGGESDERLGDAARIVVRAGYGSVSLLQRKMRIGYVTAARLIDQLEERGIVGPAQGSSPRDVLVGLERLAHALRSAPAPADEEV